MLPFLDVEVRRQQDGSQKTTVYRKPTHTDNYLNFKSHHSTQHKELVVRALVKRGEFFSADNADKLAEDRRIDEVLKTNSYPNRFIHTTRGKMRAKELSGARQQQGTSRQQKPLIVLPYIRGVTEKVTRVLKMHARVSTKPGKSLRNL